MRMRKSENDKSERLISELNRLWNDRQDQVLIAETVQSFKTRYDLNRKMTKEPGVEEILKQMFGRLANSFEKLSDIRKADNWAGEPGVHRPIRALVLSRPV